MKLSFSLPSKQSSNLKKPSSQTFSDENSKKSQNNAKEYVTEFDPSKDPSFATKQTLVIPPKANEWRPTKRMKNIDLPLQSDPSADQSVQFEVDSGNSVEHMSDSISYGLNIREISGSGDDAIAELRNSNPLIDPMLHKFKEDLKRLPEHNGLDEYTDMPVEGFGAALLKGYGWVEGRGIGRNAKEDVKVVEYKRWTSKEGIGFKDELPKFSDKSGQGGKVDKSDANGGKGDGEKGGRSLCVGLEVRIVGGRDMGMKGRVLEVKSGGDLVILKLANRDEEVTVRAQDVGELGSVEEERCLRKLKELKSKEENSGKDGGKRSSSSDRSNNRSSRDRRDGRENRDRRESRDDTMRERKKDGRRSKDERVSWLASHIRVRIISKALKGGRFYLKKGVVVDVVGPTTCDISMDETRELIQGVDQDLLETALPKRGGPVLVLYGRHKGIYGHLMEKDTENEIGIVRDGDTKELLNVRLEQIAEYIGDPSYIGY